MHLNVVDAEEPSPPSPGLDGGHHRLQIPILGLRNPRHGT